MRGRPRSADAAMRRALPRTCAALGALRRAPRAACAPRRRRAAPAATSRAASVRAGARSAAPGTRATVRVGAPRRLVASPGRGAVVCRDAAVRRLVRHRCTRARRRALVAGCRAPLAPPRSTRLARAAHRSAAGAGELAGRRRLLVDRVHGARARRADTANDASARRRVDGARDRRPGADRRAGRPRWRGGSHAVPHRAGWSVGTRADRERRRVRPPSVRRAPARPRRHAGPVRTPADPGTPNGWPRGSRGFQAAPRAPREAARANPRPAPATWPLGRGCGRHGRRASRSQRADGARDRAARPRTIRRRDARCTRRPLSALGLHGVPFRPWPR